jgi:hypothetical protein
MDVLATRLHFGDGHQRIKAWCYPKLTRAQLMRKAMDELHVLGFNPRPATFRWMRVPCGTVEEALTYVRDAWQHISVEDQN